MLGYTISLLKKFQSVPIYKSLKYLGILYINIKVLCTSGMVFGAYFWGICSDIKGRRSVILGSMGLDTIFAIISCLTQCLAMFFIARVGNGFA